MSLLLLFAGASVSAAPTEIVVSSYDYLVMLPADDCLVQLPNDDAVIQIPPDPQVQP